MFMITMCEKFHWDYYTYMKQPSWFIELAKIKMQLDNEELSRRH